MRVDKMWLRIFCFAILLVGVSPADFCVAAEVVDPETFALNGTIQLLEAGRLVIDDTNYYYDAGTIFYSETGGVIGSGYFTKGMAVGFEIKGNSGRAKRDIARIGKIKRVK